jgi:hypothetical protein
MADCGATGAAETGVNKAAIPIRVAAKVIFVSMVFTLLGLGRPASSIRNHLCVSTLNLAATNGSSGIHPGHTRAGQKPALSMRCSQVFLRARQSGIKMRGVPP